MDALRLLKADHDRVRGLFKRFKDAEEKDDAGQMGVLAATIATELEVHTTIEEEIFYPAVRDATDEIDGLVDEGLEEHKVAKTLLGEVSGLKPGDDQFVAKMKVLIESVEHHAEEEETEMFPKIRSAFDADTRNGLADKLEAGKKKLGAPTLADKIDLTKAELDELASDQEIPGRSKMSAEELAATVAPG